MSCPGATGALSKCCRRDATDDRGIVTSGLEDVAEDLGEPLIPIDALRHSERAAELHLFCEQDVEGAHAPLILLDGGRLIPQSDSTTGPVVTPSTSLLVSSLVGEC
jgi:hypothetical protein